MYRHPIAQINYIIHARILWHLKRNVKYNSMSLYYKLWHIAVVCHDHLSTFLVFFLLASFLIDLCCFQKDSITIVCNWVSYRFQLLLVVWMWTHCSSNLSLSNLNNSDFPYKGEMVGNGSCSCACRHSTKDTNKRNSK